MDCYFSAIDEGEALSARDLTGGPAPENDAFDSVAAKDIIVCPHLEQLIGAATGAVVPSAVAELRVLWPPAGTPPPTGEGSLFLTEPSITEVPDRLRDALADVPVTQAVAEAWSGALWGYGPDDAFRVASGLVDLARRAQSAGRHLYWWSEL